ncbi:MAG: hypothetical protein ACE5F1_15845 [Planctomycetota bacterium]
MAKRFSRRLKDAIRGIGHRATVDQLKRKGIDRVQVVGLDKIAALIEAAVHKTLKHRMMGFDGLETHGEIAGATREEFMRLMRSKEKLAKEREELSAQKRELEDVIDRLRRERLSMRKKLRERERSLESIRQNLGRKEDRAFISEFEELFEEEGRASPEELRERALALVLGKLNFERDQMKKPEIRAEQEDIHYLHQRISKMTDALHATESQLRELLRAKSIDPGISSLYREVQGLSEEDDLFEIKKGLMDSIYEANLELRKSM